MAHGWLEAVPIPPFSINTPRHPHWGDGGVKQLLPQPNSFEEFWGHIIVALLSRVEALLSAIYIYIYVCVTYVCVTCVCVLCANNTENWYRYISSIIIYIYTPMCHVDSAEC